jgi:hypothetical protein
MSDAESTRAQRLRALFLEYEEYRTNHGDAIGEERVGDALKWIQGRRSRLAALQSDIAELRREVRWLEDEIDGREAAVEAMLRDALDRWERMVLHAWSPVPVLGYRLWTIKPDGLHGARMVWTSRSLTARCAASLTSARVPHSDGRCGRLGCGVYATKRVEPLIHLTRTAKPQVVVGVASLTGKVVEHDEGYRGEHAELVAAAALMGTRYLETRSTTVIDELCRAPAATIRSEGRPLPPNAPTAAAAFLTTYVEGRSTWI